MKKSILFVTLLTLGFTNCEQKPDRKFFTGMYDSPAIEAQEADSFSSPEWNKREAGSRMPPRGTIPAGYVKYPFNRGPEDRAAAGAYLKNPLPMSEDILRRGEKMYLTYCEPCHGPKADAQRNPVLFPGARTLVDDYARKAPDGQIFHTITNGNAIMKGYASQIRPADRWAIVNYLRLVQARAAK